MARGVGDDGVEHGRAVEGAPCVVDEGEDHLAGLHDELLHAELFGLDPDERYPHERLGGAGRLAEAVVEPHLVALQFLLRRDGVELAIEHYPLALTGHPALGEVGGQVGLYGAVGAEGLLLAAVGGVDIGELARAELAHGLVEHLLVGLVAEVGDKSALLRAEHIARAADVEVLQGDAHAAAQIGEALDGLETAAALVAQGRERRGDEVAVGAAGATAHTAAHLVEVAQAEVLRALDDDGAGQRDIDAVLHDGGRDEHIVVVQGKARHGFLHVLGLHLAVGYHDAGALDEPLYGLLDLRQP